MHIVTLKRIVFAFGEKKRISVNDELNLTENRDKLFVTVIINDCIDINVNSVSGWISFRVIKIPNESLRR